MHVETVPGNLVNSLLTRSLFCSHLQLHNGEKKVLPVTGRYGAPEVVMQTLPGDTNYHGPTDGASSDKFRAPAKLYIFPKQM